MFFKRVFINLDFVDVKSIISDLLSLVSFFDFVVEGYCLIICVVMLIYWWKVDMFY